MASRSIPVEAIPLLGQVQDNQLSAALGVSARSVYRERKARGISKARRNATPSPAAQSLLQKLRDAALAKHRERSNRRMPEQALPLLGKVPDWRLARALGVKQLLVSRERRFRHIPPLKGNRHLSANVMRLLSRCGELALQRSAPPEMLEGQGADGTLREHDRAP